MIAGSRYGQTLTESLGDFRYDRMITPAWNVECPFMPTSLLFRLPSSL